MMAHHAFDVKDLLFGGRSSGCWLCRLFRAVGLGFFRFGKGTLSKGPVMRRILHFKQIQSQRIHADREARQTHGRSADHRVHLPGKQSRRQGDTDCIIEECPEQILVDVAKRCAAEPDRRGNIGQAAVHQHNVGAVDGDIGSRADGDANIRPCESRGIVDAVAHHGHLAAPLKTPDHALLSIRQDAGNHGVDTRLSTDGLCGTFVVAGQHDHFNPHVPELSNRLRRVFLDHIGHRDHPGKFPILCEEEGCLPLRCQRFGLPAKRIADRNQAADICAASCMQSLSVERCGEAVARQSMEV